jgi:hypothetical protein
MKIGEGIGHCIPGKPKLERELYICPVRNAGVNSLPDRPEKDAGQADRSCCL